MNRFLLDVQSFFQKNPVLLWVVVGLLGAVAFQQIMRAGESIGKMIYYLSH
ncbi:hypothetical protein [Paenibacillus hexagrammi]|uniref:Uncharacterized protein n=1 Tax=Paenibacillus hexagrammi TaxID=2908839 RepID=A0ABY3SL74_9BACL|nr:hypothetical protein [Paenibacillus sp. YPD9-1]UJF34228.1 hypothetical protein L0M14_03070 [Paenibacillus sp. YPD9-1]